MKVIDLSHKINEEIPIFPGTEAPKIVLKNTIERDGFEERCISIYSHVGTHMDAPKHILKGCNSLADYKAEKFVGKAVVIDVRGAKEIEVRDLEKNEDKIVNSDYVLFYTGWNSHWKKKSYFEGFSCLNKESAKWLTTKSLKGIGVDAISFDPVEDENLTNHRILLGSNLVLIENLTNLDKCIEKEFYLSCAPLKIEDADGSPIRALAIEI